MPPRSNNAGEIALSRGPRTTGSAGFRAAFVAVACRRPLGAREFIGPTKYIEAAKRHDKFGAQKEFLFFNDQFGLSDGLYTPLTLYLPRPEYREVPRESIVAIDPLFAEMDVRRIRDVLSDASLGPSMFQATQKFTVLEMNSKEARIVIEDPSCIGPTHMLVVYGKITSNTQVNLKVHHFAVHSVVLAAHCSKLPPLPPPNEPIARANDIREFILPVVPIHSDSHPFLGMLLEYLYVKDSSRLLALILGVQVPEDPRIPDSVEVAATMLAAGRIPFLSNILRCLTVLWENACYLGVYDCDFWKVCDVARKTVLMAMAMCGGRQDTRRSIKSVAAVLDHELEPTGVIKEEEQE